MIINYLIELLKDNECVIVPEFGAFISQRRSATIDYANHSFMPPYKELVFNNKLTNDDDLLLNYIMQKENISKDEALEKIQKFVNQSAAILDVNFDRRNFYNKMKRFEILEQLEERVMPTPKKEAFLFRFNIDKYQELKQKGFRLEF
jgi:hypothetical protein